MKYISGEYTQEKLINFFNQTDNYYVRIRKNTDHGHGNVYYNGIKIYEIKKKIFRVNEKLVNFNSTNINKNDKEVLINELTKYRKFFYEDYNLNSISFEQGGVVKKKIEFDNYLKELKKDIREKINEKFTFKEEKKVRNTKNKKEEYTKYSINFETPLLIDDEYTLFHLIYADEKYKQDKDDKIYNVFKSIDTKFKSSQKTLSLKEYLDKSNDFVNSYFDYTDSEDEKIYQHQFLLNAYMSDDGPFAGTLPFEEEYNIESNSRNGRIDCVFYKTNDSDEISDIYLIEIKVNDKVLGGSNGIKKHLEDIRKIKKNEFKTIKDLINYRNQYLGSSSYELVKNYNVYFYIIIAWENEIEKKAIYDKINGQLKNEIISQYNLTNCNSKNNIKVMMYIDENPWKKNSNKFESKFKTDWFKNEQS